ncbi:MAG: hypothetical protein ACKOX2_15720 [Microcystaceae cyanobacterium]
MKVSAIWIAGIITAIAGAKATVSAIKSLQEHPLEVKALQDYL